MASSPNCISCPVYALFMAKPLLQLLPRCWSLSKQGSNRVQLSPNQALFCWLHLLLWTGWKRIKAEQLFWSLRLNASMVCLGTRQVSCIELYLAGRRTNKGLLIVVSSQRPDMMIEDYYQRWHIETLFGCLKSRGFDLEATHMTETVIGQLIEYFEIERIRTWDTWHLTSLIARKLLGFTISIYLNIQA